MTGEQHEALDAENDHRVELTPWMIWGLSALHLMLWIIVALGYSWPEISGEGNAAIPDFIEYSIQNSPAEASTQERMLAAQESMAGFASWMYLLGVATLLTTTGGTIALVLQIRATHRALDLSAKAHDFTEERMQLEMRPWVTLRPLGFKFAPGEIPTVEFVTKNSGQTPALAVLQSVNLYIGSPPSPSPGMDMGLPGLIGAGDQIVDRIIWERPLQPSEFVRIVQGNWIVRFHAVVTYSSVFGSRHESTVAAEWSPARRTFVSSLASPTTLT